MKKTQNALLLIAIILVSTFFVSESFAASNEKIPVIIGFKGSTNASLIQAQGGEITHQFNFIHAVAASLPTQAITALQKNPNVAYVEEDFQVNATADELDNSWGVKHIGAGTVQQSGNKGTGIKVAVLDTGINYLHEELSKVYYNNGIEQKVYQGGYDFIQNDADPFDDNGHGTHCAGIIAAADDHNDVVVGVAPQVSLFAVKVLNSAGSGSVSTIISGIQWAINNDMQVISMSLGSSFGSLSLQQACDAAYANNIVVVAAAGNNGAARSGSNINYPAKYNSVIAVGATDSNDVRAYFSCTGPELELVAPGVSILSTYIDVSPNDGRNIDVVYMSGTSMATPHVAGVAALVLASPIDSLFDADHDGAWDAFEVRAKMQASADDLGASGKDNYYGYGLADAIKATTGSVDNASPTIADMTPADGSTINSATPTISASVADASGVDSKSVTMQLDDNSVSDMTYVSGTVSYRPTLGLGEGSHTALVRATDMKGNTATKSWIFTVDTVAPSQVIGLAVTKVISNGVDLAWTSVVDAAKYNIYRDGTKVATTTTNSYSDSGLTQSTTYDYCVSAVDSAGNEGNPSNSVSATTSNTIPIRVASITMALKTSGLYTYAKATVKIVDANNQAISGATVAGMWSGATTDSDTGSTKTDGTVVLQSNNVRLPRSGTTFTFTVTSVIIAGYTFVPSSSDTNSIKK